MRYAFLTLVALASGCQHEPEFIAWEDPKGRALIQERLEAQVAAGDEHAALTLILHTTWFEPETRSEAIPEIRALAEAGNPHAMSFLGAVYQKDDLGAERDYEEAARWLRLAAGRGDTNAADQLAHYKA